MATMCTYAYETGLYLQRVNQRNQADESKISRLRRTVEASQRGGLKQSELLQQCLRISTFPWIDVDTKKILLDAVIVGLDVEWYEHSPENITELGVSILDLSKIRDWSSAWSVLRTMTVQHVRIKANAHLINSDKCPGYPTCFQFGRTTFVDFREATAMLRAMFTHVDERGQLRPVLFLGHAVENDVRMIRDRLGFDIESLGSIVATIDTQILAIETGYSPTGRKKKLSDLLAAFNIRELYLHNAGNDIVCTNVAAVLMSRKDSTPATGTFYNSFRVDMYRGHSIIYGTMIFCTKCGSAKHVAENCVSVFWCEHCLSDPARRQNAHTHRSDKCVQQLKDKAQNLSVYQLSHHPSFTYAIPCPYCIESPDPRRHDFEFAYGHQKEGCVFGSP